MASEFAYVIFIKTEPEKLWAALTESEFTTKFWYGVRVASAWTVGSPWQITLPDGRVADKGRILECERPWRLVIAWHNDFMPELKAEGPARCTIELEPLGDVVKLSITHTMERDGSKLIAAVSGGWPKILSNLKSLLETGKVIMTGASTGSSRAG